MIRVTEVRVPLTAQLAVSDVLQTGRLAAGKYVIQLERLAASVSATADAVAVNSGTTALMMALQAAGVMPGDRVVIPAFTFAGTANAVYAAGAIPVCVDVGEDRLVDVEQAIAAAAHWDTEFVMPVHLYGALADCQTLADAGLTVVEDAAQAIGQPLVEGGISLYGSKTVGCGEGGLYVTSDPELAEWARMYRNQGMVDRYDHRMPGFNFRLTDLQAAVALGQLMDLPDVLTRRSENATLLWSRLHDLPVGLPNPFGQVWHQFVVEVDHRDEVAALMVTEGVETAVHYPVALPDIPWIGESDTPVARRLAARVLSLPVHEHLSRDDVERVAAVFRSAVEKCLV